MVAGIPFPDIYDWTWGEIVEFIICKNEAETQELKIRANMDMKLANLIARMVMGTKGEQFDVMYEYKWLWTDKERAEAKIERIMKSLKIEGESNDG